MFIRQQRSPARTVCAPVASMSAAFSSAILTEISGYLTQKVPPKPQHTSASACSSIDSPSTSNTGPLTRSAPAQAADR